MPEHPNATLLRKMYEGLANADTRTIFDSMTDDITWHQPGTSRFAGHHHGKQAVKSLLWQLFDLTDGKFALELHDLTASDDHVVGLHRAVGIRADKELDQYQAVVCHVRDGQASEIWLYTTDLRAYEDFWS